MLAARHSPDSPATADLAIPGGGAAFMGGPHRTSHHIDNEVQEETRKETQ
jgi:hypothetical protein